MNSKSKLNTINRVAIIGAGPAGLTAVKCLRDVGLEVTAFEKDAHIGGLWNYDENAPDGGGIAYRSLKTNTLKKMTGFSDFPFPDDIPDYPHRAEVLAYFNNYADHFGLRPFIRLNTTVNHISRQEDNKWAVSYQTESGLEEVDIFDAIIVANGFYQKTYTPSLPGLDKFQGQIMHSAQYKGPEPFEGRRVVVIGSGSSGLDVAGEVGRTAEHVDLSARSGGWIVPRLSNGKPLDTNITPVNNYLPTPLKKICFQKIALDHYRNMGFTDEQIESTLKLPPYDPDKTRVSAGTTILEQLRDGNVHLKGDIQQIEPDGVRYTDGSKTKTDSLIFCTGYIPALPFLDSSILKVQDDHTIRLHRHVFHPELDTLAFMAQCRVSGPVFPVMEMQARWIAAVFTGTADLPTPAIRQHIIKKHFADCREKGKNPMQVLYANYMDQIANLIGVQPQPLKHLRILPHLLFGPVYPTRYRLDGPGSHDKAAAIIKHFQS